jgi:hypothetical protein
MEWLWILVLVVFCALIGAYVYFIEYHDTGGGGPAPVTSTERADSPR